ncbi:MAG: helix-turn-helix transcriptional regulator, partial [Solirubrobacterales bacterium]|nr:helix-turn-helix transcriptional regulator [Solirubrobacterales bacterium]
AYRDAVGLARDDAERAQLTAAAGEMAVRSGRFVPALEFFDRAAELHREAGREREAALVVRHVAPALWGLGRQEEGIVRIRAALETVGSGELDADVAALNVELGRLLMFTGQHDEAGAPLDAALSIAEALGELDVLATALVGKGTLYMFSSRWREAIALLSAGVELARERGLQREMARGESNLGNARMVMDLPGARESTEASLASARRAGNRSDESLTAANLCHVLLLTGRWGEIDRLESELLPPEGPQRPLAAYLHERLVELHALRGDLTALRAHLAALAPWADTSDPELREAYAVATGIAALAENDPRAAFEALVPAVRDALTTRSSGENLRQSWTYAVEAALALDRIDDAAELVQRLDSRPAGLVPPYLCAQLERARARVAAARAEHEAVEDCFKRAIETLAALDYRYWSARAQTDYAAWLVDQGRVDEAAPLLEEATGVLENLGAAPAVERAHGLATRSPALSD